MINCPECGAEHYPGALFCELCGAAVHPAAQAHLAAAKATARQPAVTRSAAAGEAPPPAPSTSLPVGTDTVGIAPARALRVHLPHHQAEFTVIGDLMSVGRADPDDRYEPEIDLTAYGGQERGVSRRHATIQWIEGGYVIIDQHSSNGTWLNGVRLVAGYAYQIPPGANVRFGGLLVQLSIAD